jgi:D-amino-acid oxidase
MGGEGAPRTTLTLSRRSVLCAVPAVALASLNPGCARRNGPGVAASAPPRVSHVPVDVSGNRVIRRVAGLRPFRRTGFRVEAQRFGERTVVHNYGHGGGGVSLSWGSAHLALPLALATAERRFAVLGAGAIGLATARLLQDHGAEQVTIYARALPPDTTSNIAGAQWGPFSIAEEGLRTAAFDEQFVRAAEFAWRHFQLLVGERYGVRWLPNYLLTTTPEVRDSWEESLMRPFLQPPVRLGPGEHPFTTPYAHRFHSMLIETPVYLAAIMEDVRRAGGRIVVRDFPDLQAVLALEERTIVNCTGLGAAALFGDRDLVPVKGQLEVLVPQPEIDYLTIGPMDDGLLYMFPRRDGILLGGTYQRGEWSAAPDPAEASRILAGHQRVFGGMRPAR